MARILLPPRPNLAGIWSSIYEVVRIWWRGGRWRAAPASWSRESGGFRVFVVLLIASGAVLPMALVHPWGRSGAGGRAAGRAGRPRWLVLGPGLFMGTGLVAYFGVGGLGAIVTGLQPISR